MHHGDRHPLLTKVQPIHPIAYLPGRPQPGICFFEPVGLYWPNGSGGSGWVRGEPERGQGPGPGPDLVPGYPRPGDLLPGQSRSHPDGRSRPLPCCVPY